MTQQQETKKTSVSIIIPCYNEAGNIKVLYQKILEQINKLGVGYELIFIDDGSIDETFNIIKSLHKENPNVKSVSFSRNFGHQAAIIAGLDFCKGECAIMMDADLQHPPELIPEMISLWEDGFEIVNTIRDETSGQTFFKKLTSRSFYKLINMVSKTKIEAGSADFRLLDRKVIESFKEIGEYSIFIRGMVNWMGFNSTQIHYKSSERFSGVSKYSIRKMISFALDGITSFSSMPLHISMVLGLLISLLSFIYLVYALYIRFFTNEALEGWTSIIISVLFIGGIQLISIGILGEYLGKIFYEVKKRPRYIINKKIGFG
ncbi:MAG: glycosyltransferase family 2 protein [Candidatus Methanoperedens sp.]